LCLFDLSLPDGSGYDLCELVKKREDKPVIFLTAFDDEVNVVMGLDMGADDYITKPFRIRELLSRIKSVLRRYNKQPEQAKTYIDIENIRINTLEGKVFKSGEEVLLTALEYRLLMIFANHIGQVLTRAQLLDRIWDVAGDFVNDNTLTVYIKRLREKLEDNPQSPVIIRTVRGMGYKAGQ
jgi:DNA-binding response OmpR family regulator